MQSIINSRVAFALVKSALLIIFRIFGLKNLDGLQMLPVRDHMGRQNRAKIHGFIIEIAHLS